MGRCESWKALERVFLVYQQYGYSGVHWELFGNLQPKMKRAEKSTCSNAQVPEDRDGNLSSFPNEVRMGNMIDKILNKKGTSKVGAISKTQKAQRF